jgi:hypothetical protein
MTEPLDFGRRSAVVHRCIPPTLAHPPTPPLQPTDRPPPSPQNTQGGEFGRGSAMQYGEADIQGKDFHGQDLRRSNFTSADCRNANFQGTKLQGEGRRWRSGLGRLDRGWSW